MGALRSTQDEALSGSPSTSLSVTEPLLTLPHSPGGVLSIRAKAMLFHDPVSVALLEQVERIAPSDASVLIVGDTGTGKELVARHIHTRSGRRGPFVAVNCGAFSENLIDAELFGHEAGAFTGASQARAGWFEAANGGTLFLDEIGDLPFALQVKLLRVLQERQVVRLGSRRPISLDVRLVAATNIDLRQAVDAQHFRADLYYRLNVAPLTLPPLRERTGDILPLAQHFLRQYGPRVGIAHANLSPESQDALLAYPWPGNIRELENVIHFALVVCRHGVVQASDLRLVATAPVVAAARAVATVPQPVSDTPSNVDPHTKRKADLVAAIDALIAAHTPDLFHTVEEALVQAAYRHSQNNQVKSARLLGITRNTLRTLLKRFGLITDGGAESAHAGDESDEVENAVDGAHEPVRTEETSQAA
jgi:sigma-54-specific transcriptional regulator